ncbi:MAG: hypothetical protein ABT940_12700 [Alphaproteobacteria bacterium]
MVLGALAVLLAWPGEALAHAFGYRFDLPLPVWLFGTGASAAIVASFVVMALVLRRPLADHDFPGLSLLFPGLAPMLTPLVRLARLAGVVALFATIATGLAGTTDVVRNLAPTLVWVLWWIGLAYVSALVGDLWRVLEPWSTLHGLLPGRLRQRPRLDYPRWLGAWPAIAVFSLFAWSELVAPAGADPRTVGWAALTYTFLTLAGMVLFGRETWLRNGEVFTLIFGLFARFAPFVGRLEGNRVVTLRLRPYGVGLLNREPVSWPWLCLILVVLSTVTFDGLMATPQWIGALEWTLEQPQARALLISAKSLGIDAMVLAESLALAAVPVVFLAAFLACCRLVGTLAGSPHRAGTLARAYALSLVPIAIAYHLGHYLSFLALTGQQIVYLVSDPFGFGWNLFGTAGYRIDSGVLDPEFTWMAAVVAIVLGHVFSVFLAHATALHLDGVNRRMLLGQVPMVAFQVGYTVLSLWLFSQPAYRGHIHRTSSLFFRR